MVVAFGWKWISSSSAQTGEAKGGARSYARGQAKRALERDHLVAGSSSAMSPRGDGLGHVRDGNYGHVGGEEKRAGRKESSPRSTRRLGGGLGAAGVAPEMKKIDGSRRWGR